MYIIKDFTFLGHLKMYSGTLSEKQFLPIFLNM